MIEQRGPYAIYFASHDRRFGFTFKRFYASEAKGIVISSI